MFWKFAEIIKLGSVDEIKYWIYGKIRLSYKEAYKLDLEILIDLIKAYIRAEEEKFDGEMQRLAWQTALLMNSTGNYKKQIKMQDLYKSMDERKKDESKKEVDVEKTRRDLLSIFNIEL